MVDTLKTLGYKYEVSMKSPEEMRSFNIDFVLDNKIDPSVLKTHLESFLDVKVSKVKEVTEWHIPDIEKDTRGVSLVGRYKIDGQYVRSNKMYLPRLKPTINSKLELQGKLQTIFGPYFEIMAYVEKL